MTGDAHEHPRQQILQCLRDIKAGAEDLQKALLTRQHEEISRRVEAQERSLALLRNFCSDGAGASTPPLPDADLLHAEEGLRRLAQQTRSVLRRNRILATRFLNAIGRTLRAFDAVGAATIGTYDAGGRHTPSSGPRLVQRKV